MKIFIPFIVILGIYFLNASVFSESLHAAAKPLQSVSSSSIFRLLNRSDIALTPEWQPDNINDFAPLHPTVVVWGNDPVHWRGNSQSHEKQLDEYKALGINRASVTIDL